MDYILQTEKNESHARVIVGRGMFVHFYFQIKFPCSGTVCAPLIWWTLLGDGSWIVPLLNWIDKQLRLVDRLRSWSPWPPLNAALGRWVEYHSMNSNVDVTVIYTTIFLPTNTCLDLKGLYCLKPISPWQCGNLFLNEQWQNCNKYTIIWRIQWGYSYCVP
jgi:hypothetical protein